MAAVRADTPEPGVRIYQCVQTLSVDMLNMSISPMALLRVLVAEVLREVPGADFIEIRAIRYDPEKGNDSERSVSPVPPGE